MPSLDSKCDESLSISTGKGSERSCVLQDRGKDKLLLNIHSMAEPRRLSQPQGSLVLTFIQTLFVLYPIYLLKGLLSHFQLFTTLFDFFFPFFLRGLSPLSLSCFWKSVEKTEKIFNVMCFLYFMWWLAYKEHPLLGKISFEIFLFFVIGTVWMSNDFCFFSKAFFE